MKEIEENKDVSVLGMQTWPQICISYIAFYTIKQNIYFPYLQSF